MKISKLALVILALALSAFLVLSPFIKISPTGWATSIGVVAGSIYSVDIFSIQPALNWAGIRGNLTTLGALSINITGNDTIYSLNLLKAVDCTGPAFIIASRSNQLAIQSFTIANSSQVDALLDLPSTASDSGTNTFTNTSNFSIFTYSFTNAPTTFTYNETGTEYPLSILFDSNAQALVFVTQVNTTQGQAYTPYQLMLPITDSTSSVYYFTVLACQAPLDSSSSQNAGSDNGGGSSTVISKVPNVTQSVLNISKTSNAKQQLITNINESSEQGFSEEQAKQLFETQLKELKKLISTAKAMGFNTEKEEKILEELKWLAANKQLTVAFKTARLATKQLQIKLETAKPENPTALGLILIAILIAILVTSIKINALTTLNNQEALETLAKQLGVKIKVSKVRLDSENKLLISASSLNPIAIYKFEKALLSMQETLKISSLDSKLLLRQRE